MTLDEQILDSTDDEEVVDGEIVNDDDKTIVEIPLEQTGAAGLLNLEDLINNHIESIEKLKNELKQAREMYDDSFANNPTYKEHVDKVKDVAKTKNEVKQQIAKQPSVATLEQKVKDLRFDIGESSKTLSDLLQDYKEQTGSSEIETRDGQLLEIVSTSKLVKRSSK